MTVPRRKPQTYGNAARTGSQPESATIVTMPMPVQQMEREPRLPLERIGDILRREREKRGDDLQQIAEYLCIRRGFLEAIESSRYNEFSADAYVVGFLRCYAEYLGLDGKDTIDYYRREMSGRRKKPALILPTPISEGRTPSAIIMMGAAVVAILIYAAWYGFLTSDRAAVTPAPALPSAMSETVPAAHPSSSPVLPDAGAAASLAPAQQAAIPAAAAPVAPAPAAAMPIPAATAPVPTMTAPPPQAAAPTPSPAAQMQDKPASPPPQASRLTIRAEQASWVLIANSRGQTIFDRVLKPGEAFNVPDLKGLTLTTGNGAGITVTLDGADMPKFSTSSSRILRGIPLDTSYLKALPATPEE